MRSFAYTKNQVNLLKKPDVDQVVYKGSPVLSENYVHVESCSASNNGSVEKLDGVRLEVSAHFFQFNFQLAVSGLRGLQLIFVAEFCVLFKFQRKLFYQLCSTCIPVFLLVIASFCPFYMSIRSTSSRVNVCVIVFQAMIGIVMQVSCWFSSEIDFIWMKPRRVAVTDLFENRRSENSFHRPERFSFLRFRTSRWWTYTRWHVPHSWCSP